MAKLLKACIILGLTPLTMGILIFLAWVFTRWDWLTFAGIVTTFAGLCAVGIGTICLAIYLWRSWRTRAVPGGRLAEQAVMVLCLYFGNFVAAYLVAGCAVMIRSQYTVCVANHGSVPLDSARIGAGEMDVPLGRIAPGGSVKRTFRMPQDDSILLYAERGGARVYQMIDGYAPAGRGGEVLVTVEPDGVIRVEKRR